MTLHEAISCLANISKVLDQNNTKRPTGRQIEISARDTKTGRTPLPVLQGCQPSDTKVWTHNIIVKVANIIFQLGLC